MIFYCWSSVYYKAIVLEIYSASYWFWNKYKLEIIKLSKETKIFHNCKARQAVCPSESTEIIDLLAQAYLPNLLLNYVSRICILEDQENPWHIESLIKADVYGYEVVLLRIVCCRKTSRLIHQNQRKLFLPIRFIKQVSNNCHLVTYETRNLRRQILIQVADTHCFLTNSYC